MLNKYGDGVLDTNEIINLIYSNPDIRIDKLNILSSNEVILYNKAIQELYVKNSILTLYKEPKISIQEFDFICQQNWHMPQEYKDMDIVKYILSLCENNEAVLQRVGYELLEFQKLKFFNALRFFKYFVDTVHENNIVLGVGRGSCVSSHVLFLLGVHKIDSLKYQLDFNDFIKV